MKLSQLKAELLRILSQSISPDLPTSPSPSSPDIHLKFNRDIKGKLYDVVDSKTGIVLSQCLISDDTINTTINTTISPKGGE